MKIANRWIIVFFIFPFLNIYTLKTNFQIELSILCLLPSLVAITQVYKSKYLLQFDIFILLFALSTLFPVLLNGTVSLGVMYSIFTLLGICLYVNRNINNFTELIRGLYYLFSVIIIINFVSIIIFPNGIPGSMPNNPIFFLGAKNTIQITILPAISIILLYSYYMYEKLRFIPFILLIISFISLYFSGSGTAIVIMGLAVIFLSIYKFYSLSFKTYILVYFLIFVSIVILRLQEVLFGELITNYLNKDISFTGRTYIWDIALEKIKESWLIGYGRGNSVIFENTSNSFFYKPTEETHNGFLEVLLNSGLIGIVVLFSILFVIGNRLDKYKHHIISRVLSFSIISFLIIGLVESVFYKIEFWIILVISFNIDKIVVLLNRKKLYDTE
ncbi:O-antigen ligase family protein [Neobacillus novalis]|uniref:O-antigen ligase family protein n=1 Tax=Neobacillus novalis TaxID=220687 RepID=A0AA95MT47_9BACI|nr:O-antigen ligase family protein [Neobacillus novalis]WHY86073.1 O-antigen ligase family protein [Neobacillus novalis]